MKNFIVCLCLASWTAFCVNAAAGSSSGPVKKSMGAKMYLSQQDIMGVIGQLIAKVGSAQTERVERGVRQVARLWKKQDGTPGEFASFCVKEFVTGDQLEALFHRWESKMEAVAGHFDGLSQTLRLEMDEARGPLQPVDMLFAKWNPGAHVTDDLFHTKLAFVALLNFPLYSLNQMLEKGASWSRMQWAQARLVQGVAHRVPAEVQQKVSSAYTSAENYIANYNICMDHVLGPDKKPMFRKGLKLISHWGLRDELKAMYSDPANLPKQEMILTIMERIISQQIPQVVIDNCSVDWDPVSNKVNGKDSAREPDTRFVHLLEVFRAEREQDQYYPDAPSHMARRFELEREIPEKEVEALLDSVLSAPEGKLVADLIRKRLGRDLRPFDIWYDGFKARGSIDERKLDEMVAKRFPTVDAYQKSIPDILQQLGFDEKTAKFLGDHIEVDPARGAGHAWGPKMRGQKAHLRTRVPEGGMNYKGFNIAMHEMGHNIEQVFTLYRVDHTLLQGVPNNAFTEGFAFVFQARDLQVLGLGNDDATQRAFNTLDDFWMTREIAAVGLVDMKVWHWMYAHPDASADQLNQAVTDSAKQVWNKYFAREFGVKDSPIFAIYSHMIAYGLYLPDYPLGYLIAFQVKDYFRDHPLGTEMERMCKQGRIVPNLWMKGAVGKPISAQPLLMATKKAIEFIKK